MQNNKSNLTDYQGWLILDYWSGYFKSKNAIRSAHLLREFESQIEKYQTDTTSSKQLKSTPKLMDLYLLQVKIRAMYFQNHVLLLKDKIFLLEI
jgi:hypothetical protein